MACDQERQVSITGGSDGSIRLWALGGSQCRGRLQGHAAAVTCLCLGPLGVLFSGSEDGTIAVWSSLPGGGAAGGSRRLGVLEEPGAGGRRSRSSKPTGAAGGQADGQAAHSSGAQCVLCAHSAAVTALLVLPGGRRLASCSRDGAVVVWEWYSGAVVARRHAGQELLCLALRHCEQELLVGAASGDVLRFGMADLLAGGAAGD
jgi:WD40 repeat protein